MIQTTQSNNIIAEPNNLVKIDQGGTRNYAVGRIYWNYDFLRAKGKIYNPDIAKYYAEIGREFAIKVAEGRIVKISSGVQKSAAEKQSVFGNWKPPAYIDNPAQKEIKNNLKKGVYGNCLWMDYEWYAEFKFRSPITNLMVVSRDYNRAINVLSNEINTDLIKDIHNISIEGGTAGIVVYPHSKIEHMNDDRETLRHYVHNDDFIVKVGINNKWALIVIQPNPKYMTYSQLIETIEPIFEKYGFKLNDTINPYLKCGFSLEEEILQHREYPCAGYRFFD